MTVTLDLGEIAHDDLLSAIREIDREATARAAAYPRLVDSGKLTADQVEARRLELATAREIVAVVARAMIGANNKVLQVLPVLPVEAVSSEQLAVNSECGDEA